MPEKGLSLPEFTALLVLAVEAREMSNSELKEHYRLTIDGKKRQRLNDLKLVESRQPRRGRAFVHVLTDSGWARLADDLRSGTIPPQTGSSGAIARALLAWLPRFMRRTDQRLSEIFEPEPEAPPAGLESRVRAAYAELAAEPGAWVSLTPLRRLLPGVPKAEVDEALVLMERLPDVNLVPESNQKTLTPEDREAAVIIGEQDKHLLWIGKP
ncbi:hypothetical protein ACFFV7_28885 [Nonomuraea spiralis]|uniref:MarR family transcriptional regulator n=1 Tax=Nonomuraea spiralis TaxID=46182 RepID=A0ABV5IL34_9ACTN|nr:hypothetical protein [Nonomuraea spiralis]GGT23551.1 hypothetical protein GCM10010176_080170 [Nonomuraea spiralis]